MSNRTATDSELISAFYEAAIFMKDRVDNHGWKKSIANYLREHVRSRTGLNFSNTRSPKILDEIRLQHPELRPYIDVRQNMRKRVTT